MALIYADRVKETSTTTGTGALTLDGAGSSYRTFSSGVGNGNTCYYVIAHLTANEWEVGLGTIGAGTLTRTTVLRSSNSNNAVSLSAGTKSVFCTLPADVIDDLVSGPASATDNAIARFDGTSGKLVQNTGVTIDDNNKMKFVTSYSDIVTVSDGSIITFNLNSSNVQQTTLGGNRTLAVSNVSVGQRFMIKLKQDGTGSRTVTWFSGIKWPGNTVPTLTTTANYWDWFGFICTGTGVYGTGDFDAFILGKNYG